MKELNSENQKLIKYVIPLLLLTLQYNHSYPLNFLSFVHHCVPLLSFLIPLFVTFLKDWFSQVETVKMMSEEEFRNINTPTKTGNVIS